MTGNLFGGNPLVLELVRLAIAEDIGTGDVTTGLVIRPGAQASGRILARQSGIVAGLPVVEMVFSEIDPAIRFEAKVADGQWNRVRFLVKAGRSLLRATHRLAS